MPSKPHLLKAGQRRWDEVVAEVGDGEPTEQQYRRLHLCAYTDRNMHFCDFMHEGERWTRIYQGRSAEKAKVFGDGKTTGQAYWAYRKALDKALAPV